MNAAAQGLVRLPVWRARFVLAALLAAFAVLVARSLYLQALKTDFLQEKGDARYSRVIEVPATRGRIVDRHGDALAVSTPVKSIWAIPSDAAELPAADREKLAALLALARAELDRKLDDPARDFVYLKRQVPPETADAIAALGLNGIHQHREFRRYYPAGEVTAHVIGFTGVEDAGQEGVELAFQQHLGGKPGSRRVIKDRLGRIVEDVESIRSAQDGRDLALSIDGKLQSLAFGALKKAVEQHRAKAGALVAIDVRTGEILALANVPSYNPNNRARTGAQLRNRVITDLFEPGSTLKPFTIALALETGKVAPATVVATAPGRMTIANYTIRDVHPEAALTVAQVIQKSSNVGAAKLALAMPREAMWDLYKRLGFGEAPQLGFPGAAAGRLRNYRSWRPIEQATMAYGMGISVSLVQLARAYTVFARDGELVPLTLVKTGTEVSGEKVLSTGAARAVRAMLELAVQPGGTGPRARIMGWRVAGKTGTAHKLENGGYAADRYLASFVGLAPASAPRLVIAVMLDEPTAGQHYGGAVAAPVFAQVMQGALRLLGAPHDAPLEPVELPGEGQEAKEST
ncbi:MAG: cell division protein [Betaproteobacteria bacterium RIFCSPLOWO2_12_FULL_65_14]|nr:MAG: cell division protein [Betaproteobacteria bacterium RIFCSPLOWO2_12_FULL_65_14]